MAAAADIFGSLESRNEHKSILRRAHKRVEDRTWAGFSPLFFFSASTAFVGTGRADRPVGSEQGKATKEMRKRKEVEGKGGNHGEEDRGWRRTLHGGWIRMLGEGEGRKVEAISCVAPYAPIVDWRGKTQGKE